MLAIFALAMIMAAIKLAIVALIIGGLIFRTKETIGLLVLGGLFTLIAAHPIAGLSVLAGTITIGVILKERECRKAQALDDPAQE